MGALIRDEASGLSYQRLEMGVPSGLLVLLHGVGASETDMVELGRSLADRYRVVLPRGPLLFGPGGFGWFEVRFTAQGPVINARQAETSRLRLGQLLESLQVQGGMSPARTVIAGFSQGGIMSAGLALTLPKQVAGFGLLSGRILPEIRPQLGAPGELARLSAFVSHGREDATLPAAWAERSGAWLQELGVPHQLRLYPAGHELTQEMRMDFRTWLDALLP